MTTFALARRIIPPDGIEDQLACYAAMRRNRSLAAAAPARRYRRVVPARAGSGTSRAKGGGHTFTGLKHVRIGIGGIALAAMVLAGTGWGIVRAAPQQDLRALLTDRPATERRRPGPREFYFTRGIYHSPWRWHRSWATDFPKADRQFMAAVDSLVDMDVANHENAVRLDDPDLRRFPFLYMLEIEGMALTASEVAGLRDYLLAGGFLVVDDFWGEYAFADLEHEMRRVLPEHPIAEIPPEHPIFNTVYRIEEIVQVPAIGRYYGGVTTECYGCDVFMRGIFDDAGRLMVVINGNTDLGDAWEWFERPEYPLQFSSFAVQMGVNFIVYAMSH